MIKNQVGSTAQSVDGAGESSPFARQSGCVADYDSNGVDLTLLRYLLQLRPYERLVQMERHARDTQQLLDYGRKHRETETRSSC